MTHIKGKKILSYKGELTFDIIEEILSQFIDNIAEYNLEKVIFKRLYSILVESLENTLKHRVNTISGLQHKPVELILVEISDRFVLTIGNYIKNEKIDKLIDKLNKVNSLDKIGISQLYRKTIFTAEISEKGGAGLGIIEIARNSRLPIGYNLNKNEKGYTFFSFIIEIKK
jgi:hypothetical protein